MNFQGEYRQLGTVPITPLQDAVRALPPERWLEDSSRQKLFDAHVSTATIKLIFDPDYRHTDPTRHPAYDALLPQIEPMMTLIRDAHRHTLRQRRWIARHGEGYFIRIILTRLEPRAEIAPHADGGHSLKCCHRIHVPVETNPGCSFFVGGVAKTMQPGEVWEINNRMVHAVRNDGDEARIHLILDYVQPGETVLDPDGPLVA